MPRTSAASQRLRTLIARLAAIRAELLQAEAQAADQLAGIPRASRPSARNFLHYLALRRHDLRRVQASLAALGLSSLGRCEAHVLASVERVQAALAALAGVAPPESGRAPPVDERSGPRRLQRHALELFGAAPAQRNARIMVTLAAEAATDPAVVDDLITAGMDLARINCAHDDVAAWTAMIRHCRTAARRQRKPCPVLMDLAGPKLRTGPIAPGPQVVVWHPQRDALGRVTAPARVALVPDGAAAPDDGAAAIPIPAAIADLAQIGDGLAFTDARGKQRTLTLMSVGADGTFIAEAAATAYVEPGTVLHLRRGKQKLMTAALGALPPSEQVIRLAVGDHLILTADGVPGGPGHDGSPARIPCSLPEVIASVRVGQRIWFDDGRIGGVVRAATRDALDIDITTAPLRGARLRADRGINLPDTDMTLPLLDAQDRSNLGFARKHADLIGLSFIRRPDDLDELDAALAGPGPRPGIVLKIETPQGFSHLPAILLRALALGPAGVMVARGDLAVEVGFARLAEVQEEILWLCEAAHMPVIWGTQVLESLAKKGLATRAEVTDAAMSVRAECVMLNKGPQVTTAVRFLDDVLTRMRYHQAKKRTLLRSLSISRAEV
jgi:pyruvate kinase